MKDNKLVNKIKSVIAWEHTPCLIYMLVMLVFHMGYQCSNDDAALIRDTLKPTVWEEFASVAYNFSNWSSRVLVNLPIHIMLHFDYKVWLVLELLLLFLFFRSLSYIFVTENKTKNNYMLLLLLLVFPFDYALSAGWVTTTMTYIWPIALVAFSCTTIRKVLAKEGFKWYHYPLFFLTTIYGANQEQLSVILTVCFLTFVVILIREKKASAMIFMQSVLVSGNLLFHMLAPGNSNRSQVEATVRFTDYNTLSLIDKLELGFSSSLYEFFFRFNRLFLFIGILVLVVIWSKTKQVFYRLIAMVPLLAQLVFGIGCNKLLEEKLHIGIFVNRMKSSGTIDESNYYRWVTYYPIVLLFAVSICLIVCLYIIFGNSKRSVMAIALLFGGLGGRMVVAFSPTVWASSNRTYIVMYMAFVCLGAMVAGELEYARLGKKAYVMQGFMAVVALMFVAVLANALI